MWDYDAHNFNIAGTKCTCGKDLCNFGDSRGGMYIWILFNEELCRWLEISLFVNKMNSWTIKHYLI